MISNAYGYYTVDECTNECIQYEPCRYVVFFNQDNEIDNINSDRKCAFLFSVEPSLGVYRHKNAKILAKRSKFIIFMLTFLLIVDNLYKFS